MASIAELVGKWINEGEGRVLQQVHVPVLPSAWREDSVERRRQDTARRLARETARCVLQQALHKFASQLVHAPSHQVVDSVNRLAIVSALATRTSSEAVQTALDRVLLYDRLSENPHIDHQSSEDGIHPALAVSSEEEAPSQSISTADAATLSPGTCLLRADAEGSEPSLQRCLSLDLTRAKSMSTHRFEVAQSFVGNIIQAAEARVATLDTSNPLPRLTPPGQNTKKPKARSSPNAHKRHLVQKQVITPVEETRRPSPPQTLVDSLPEVKAPPRAKRRAERDGASTRRLPTRKPQPIPSPCDDLGADTAPAVASTLLEKSPAPSRLKEAVELSPIERAKRIYHPRRQIRSHHGRSRSPPGTKRAQNDESEASEEEMLATLDSPRDHAGSKPRLPPASRPRTMAAPVDRPERLGLHKKPPRRSGYCQQCIFQGFSCKISDCLKHQALVK